MKIRIIGNPVAGGARAAGIVTRLAEALSRRGAEASVYLTAAAGDARREAERSSGQYDLIVACGGDGTLNEVLNGLEPPDATPLSVFPVGTANIVARETGLAPRIQRAADAYLESPVVAADLPIARNGAGEERRFLAVAGAGFDAMVTEEVTRSRKHRLGFRGYVSPVARVLRTYRAPELRVRIDGQDVGTGAFVVVSNTRNYGGLFSLCPKAELGDGRLNVLVWRGKSLLSLVSLFAFGFLGQTHRLSGTRHFTGQEIEIDSDRPVPIQIDGDSFGWTPLSIRLDPRGVRLLRRSKERSPSHPGDDS
ncbi:MAG: diacylglycerol kinase family lipid kinase [Planctomycetota bacterium]